MASLPVDTPAKPARMDSTAVAWACLLLAALVAVYWPALRGSLLWDDDAHVTKPALQSFHGLWRVWFEVGATQQYYPLLHSAFWLEHLLWGDSVVGYHLVTLGFHWLAACLLARALRRLSFPAPWLAAFLFALHPVCVESVAWISEQKNTLSAVFYLSSALAYLSFDEDRKPGAYALASALFVCALLTKTVTTTLPAALLVVLWWRRGTIGWRDVRPLLPWFVVGIGGGLFTAWAEVTYIGATGADFALGFGERLILCGRVLCFYLKVLLWFPGVMFIYPRWSPSEHLVVQSLALLGILLLAAGLGLYARRARGPLAGFLFFAGTLFPALGFFNVYPFLFSFVADHFQYLASLGVLVPLAWAIHWIASMIPLRPAGIAAASAVPLVLGLFAHRAAGDYRDADTLNRATLTKNPEAWLAHYNLAVSLGRNPGTLDEAIFHYRETIRLNPRHWAAESNLASALLRKPGRVEEAIGHYKAALRINPDFAEAHSDLGIVLGRDPAHLSEGIAQLRQAIALQPSFDAAYNNLGDLLQKEPGHRDEALEAYGKAVALKPDDPLYHYNLGTALAGFSPDRAEAEFRKAIMLKPESMESHANLGVLLARDPRTLAEGIAELSEAVRISPGVAQAHANLANALARASGRQADAAGEFRAALSLAPGDVMTRLNFAVLLSSSASGLPEAKVQLDEVLRRAPNFAEAHFCLGVVALRLRRPKSEAVAELQRALQLKPELAPARRLLGELQK